VIDKLKFNAFKCLTSHIPSRYDSRDHRKRLSNAFGSFKHRSLLLSGVSIKQMMSRG